MTLFATLFLQPLRGWNIEKNRDTPHAKQFEEDFRKWCEAKASVKRKKV